MGQARKEARTTVVDAIRNGDKDQRVQVAKLKETHCHKRQTCGVIALLGCKARSSWLVTAWQMCS